MFCLKLSINLLPFYGYSPVSGHPRDQKKCPLKRGVRLRLKMQCLYVAGYMTSVRRKGLDELSSFSLICLRTLIILILILILIRDMWLNKLLTYLLTKGCFISMKCMHVTNQGRYQYKVSQICITYFCSKPGKQTSGNSIYISLRYLSPTLWSILWPTYAKRSQLTITKSSWVLIAYCHWAHVNHAEEKSTKIFILPL